MELISYLLANNLLSRPNPLIVFAQSHTMLAFRALPESHREVHEIKSPVMGALLNSLVLSYWILAGGMHFEHIKQNIELGSQIEANPPFLLWYGK